ncbi:MAG: class I SAM-dependent methyltransferase [Firmicutes bacterium]|nr:class I SAM-dependent methyltransferase [Bacillota bacterium]
MPHEQLRTIEGGRVLDLCTGDGGFVHHYIKQYINYTEIIGIDTDEQILQAAREKFKDEQISFEFADIYNLAYPQESFNTVCLSNSLHHLPEPQRVLEIMQGLVPKGGYVIINEMFKDNQTLQQQSHVDIHHFFAQIDEIRGMYHQETYRKQDILAMVKSLEWESLTWYEHMWPKTSDDVEPLLESCYKFLEQFQEHQGLKAEFDSIASRIRKNGYAFATQLMVIAKK